MKELARKEIKKLILVILAISFLIGNIFSIIIKKNAQSNFYKNALSFILLEKEEPDFIKTLEKYDKTNTEISLVYVDDQGRVNYNPDNLMADKVIRDSLNSKAKYQSLTYSQGFLNKRAWFIARDSGFLAISTLNKLGFYLNMPLLLAHLILGLISLSYIDKKLVDGIDGYLNKLKPGMAKRFINTKSYREVHDLLNPFIKKIDILDEENLILSSRLSEFITITSNMKEGFILFDGFGNVELINNSAKKYLGVGKDSNINTLIDNKEYILALKEASLLKRSKNVDLSLNGYDLRIFIDPLSNSSKKAFAMIVIDNTEEKKAEKMRREFSANVTHELKSPLTSINGYAELIATGIAKESDVSKFGEIIYEEGNRLLEIIDDILKISSLDEKNFDKNFIDVDIFEVVNSTIEKFNRISDKKNLTITNNIDPYRIRTSKSLFYDLVSNIYENAIKYNQVGGSITLDYSMGENNYYLKISDTGIGISTFDQERIFERFYVADKSRKRSQKSTGLGLSIVKHISSYLGYNISVSSKLGSGSTFTIEIPLQLDREI